MRRVIAPFLFWQRELGRKVEGEREKRILLEVRYDLVLGKDEREILLQKVREELGFSPYRAFVVRILISSEEAIDEEERVAIMTLFVPFAVEVFRFFLVPGVEEVN